MWFLRTRYARSSTVPDYLPAFALALYAVVGASPAVAAETQQAQIAGILDKADVAYGEYLSGQCVTCHLSKGQSDGIPPIVGLPDTYFIQTLLEYRKSSEERTNPVMVNIAKNLSDEELGSLAKYYSTLKAE